MIKDDKQLILGIGTGRCGTNSLAKFLHHQPDCFFTHEKHLIQWHWHREFPPDLFDDYNKIDRRIVGDVSLGMSNHGQKLLLLEENAKLIVIERNRDECAKSLYFWTKGEDLEFWKKNPDKKDLHNDFWYNMFPTFEGKNKIDRIYQYIDLHRELARILYAEFPGRVKIISIENLNHRQTQDEVLDFCGVQQEGRVYEVDRLNTRYENRRWKNPKHEAQIIHSTHL